MSDNYGTVNFIRDLTNLPVSDASDSDVVRYRDEVAIPRLNDEVMVTHRHEKATYISRGKDNKVDGDNKTFYLRALHGNEQFIGDLTNDGEVTADDVEVFFRYSTGERVENEDLTVTIVDDYTGEVTVEFDTNVTFDDGESFSPGDALDQGELYFQRYRSSPVKVESAERDLKAACAYLTAYFGYSKIEAPKLKQFRLGRRMEVRTQSEAEKEMFSLYEEARDRIIQRDVIEGRPNTQTTRGAIDGKFLTRQGKYGGQR